MINIYTKAVVDVKEEEWILLYEEDSKVILIEPQQASGSYTVSDVLVIASSKEELEQYIIDNKLL